MPAAPRPPRPSLLPVRATTFARKEGARGHATAAAASPVRGTPFPIRAKRGRTRARSLPLLFLLGRACTHGKGARDPPALPFPSRRRGVYGSTPPHHPASAPALPSCPRNPVRADRGRVRADRPTSPCWPRPHPIPLVRATPFARSEGVRGQEHADRGHARARDPPGLSFLIRAEGGCARAHRPASPRRPALFPFPLRATPFARKGGTRPFPSTFTQKGGARHRPALRVAPAPFPSLFAPRARASRPDLWRPVHTGRGARGQADPASLRVAQWGWMVSVRPRSPRLHRIFAHHSTT
ncbi:hypothetical protein EDB85DRAFT_2158000 [Lactarius pseudohatsudake]|nr:hypothetical protein EDB85DRAFT_2158000 [Lactarius pseudohatsudake]